MKKILFNENAKAPIYFGIILIPTCIYLGAFGSLCAVADWFTIWWLIFGFFLVFPISSAIAFALCVIVPLNNSPEGKKAAGKIAVGRIFQWLCYDFCFLSIFKNWTVPMYILGGISVVLMFIETINTFLINRKKLSLLFIFELLVGIALTIYLIYKIPDDLGNLQTVITTVIAALFGGLFTLLGVAWTIRKGDEDRKKDREQLENDRKEEERKKAIPYITVANFNPTFKSLRIRDLFSMGNRDIHKKCDKKYYYSIQIKDFRIKNISSNPIIIYGILLDGDFLKFETSMILEQNGECNLQITGNNWFNSIETLKGVFIVLNDILGNQYKLKCKLSCDIKNGWLEEEFEEGTYKIYSYIYAVEQVGIPELVIK